uniref:Uncharacterized protein n=1 Tax=Anguilla anguilla TaxID=7936 RepID=A0A0E9VJB5_ANGAN
MKALPFPSTLPSLQDLEQCHLLATWDTSLLSVLIAVKSTFSLHQSVCDNNRLFMCFCFLPVQ